jgi:hypothetical protein
MDGDHGSALEWATAESSNLEGRRLVYRFVNVLRPDFDRRAQPTQIVLIWAYQSETGQPIGTDLQRIYEFEDLLLTLDDGRLSTLALVSTGEGSRDWIFYTRSEDEFLDSLNVALAGQPVFPIDIHAAPDAAWETYQVFVDNLASD